MPLLQPASRSPRWQARNARDEVGGVADSVGKIDLAVDAVQKAAGDAQGAAVDAKTAADQVKGQVGLVFTFQQVRDSYSDDGVLSASAADGIAAISVLAHTRHYLNGAADAPIVAGSIANLLPETIYQVFYDDPTFKGGQVEFKAARTIEGALASLDAPARHYVGEVKTPVSGGAATEGGGGAGRPYWKPGPQQAQQPDDQ